ncbi:plasmid stabilization protein [Sphingomonas panacis]|uniref:Plasmid stabilization protein n=1 Tax=Sphingomonas panacis TaxID=1560345 RepID=A0A1B3Z5M6_9SPHN|nr:type II toxin-antitoxin system RelE/ParE family toxin [Sphingomonas panacis]AOH82727.1 plasmid stabilization protein [Sphingomonas panacis]
MAAWRIQEAADRRLDDIYTYTRDTWGDVQADLYLRGLFACFDDIAARRLVWRAVPRELGVDGFYCRYEHHYIYWRVLPDGAVGIVTILHERMHRIDRFRDDMPV